LNFEFAITPTKTRYQIFNLEGFSERLKDIANEVNIDNPEAVKEHIALLRYSEKKWGEFLVFLGN